MNNNNLKITFLGTGTSHGVPQIGCNCPVCTSNIEENKRLRSSILIENSDGDNLLIDPSKDFREQALRYKINHLENILITHLHADHIFGMDELRVYNRIINKTLKIYLSKKFNKDIKKIFPYIYGKLTQKGGGVTSVENIIIEPYKTFKINDFEITPIPIKHGKLDIFGYRINNMAYLTDCSYIPEKSYDYLKDIEILILDALRETPHPTHFSLKEAIDESLKINAKKTFFTHIAHNLDHISINKTLPENIKLAYDGQQLWI